MSSARYDAWSRKIERILGTFVSLNEQRVRGMSQDDAAIFLHSMAAMALDDVCMISLAEPIGRARCRPGCHECCGMNLEVAWYEAIAIASHVATKMSESDRMELDPRLTAYADEVRGMTEEQRLGHTRMCPFVRDADGLCTIYPIRPLLCRAHFVIGGTSCEEGVPVDMLLGPKTAAGILTQRIDAVRQPDPPLEPFCEFVTGVLYHLHRILRDGDAPLPLGQLDGPAVEDAIKRTQIIYDPVEPTDHKE